MNKRGIIKIIEASAAMIIIFIVILTITTSRKITSETDLSERITPLLEEIAKNNTIRDEIVSYDDSAGESRNVDANVSIRAFLNAKVDKNLQYDFKICDVDEVCGLDEYPKDITGNIYAGSRIISSSLDNSNPKKLSLFLWYYK